MLNSSLSSFVLQLKDIFAAVDANKDSLITEEEVRNTPLEEYEQYLSEILPQEDEEEEGEDDGNNKDEVKPEDNDDEHANSGKREDL